MSTATFRIQNKVPVKILNDFDSSEDGWVGLLSGYKLFA